MENKIRPLKELYEVLWNEIKDKYFIYGLCDEISELYKFKLLNESEYNLLANHFISQKFLHKEFMTGERNWLGGLYWWTRREGNNPVNRKDFIKKIISTL